MQNILLTNQSVSIFVSARQRKLNLQRVVCACARAHGYTRAAAVLKPVRVALSVGESGGNEKHAVGRTACGQTNAEERKNMTRRP